MKIKEIKPPRLAMEMLLQFLRADLAEEVLGDLDEKFYSALKNKSALRAKLNYWYQVLHYLRPFAIRKSKALHLNHYDMYQSYFKIGWRNLLKQKMYSAIKIGGFALGIAACLLISIFIKQELSYDHHFPKGDRIYRIVQEFKEDRFVHLPAPFGAALLDDYPEVEQIARINPVELFGAGSNNIRPDGQEENIYEEGFVWADPAIMTMFDIPFVYGNADQALAEPNSLVITKSKADKYFPNENPIGKIMIIANDVSVPYKIGGVIEDLPTTSHFRYHFFMTMSGKEFGQGEQTNWLQSNYPTYVILKSGADHIDLGEKLTALNEKYYLPRLLEFGYPNIQEDIKLLRYHFQPIGDIYLNELQVRDSLNHGDVRFVWLSGGIAVFILILACINFINLSTAKSANRAKEVGLRKVVGSLRSSLISQFLTESLLYSLISFLLGIGLAWSLVPFFNTLVGKPLVFPWREGWLIPGVVVGAFVIGLLAAIYPSLYLSSFKPIQVLKGNPSRGSRNATMRGTLVVFQFTISIVLVIGTFITYRQMQFILNSKVGFEKDQVLLIQGTNILGEQVGAFKNELLNVPGVRHASVSDYLPVQGTMRNGNTFDNRETPEQEAVAGQYWIVDDDYIQTLGIRLAEGRNFSDSIATDRDAIIINKAMANALGYTDPVGKRISNFKEWTIIGVVDDFNFESLKETVRPLCMALGTSSSITSVKITGTNVPSTLQSITAVWKQFAPHQAMRFTFLDLSYARMYEDIGRIKKIFMSFTLLAIIVACLGLLGLSSFLIEQRTKEISIRLVLGASVNNIVRLLTQNFIVLILISFVIATPIAWYGMKKWLQDYAYKIDITWDVFLIAGLMTIGIALLTIGYQAVRAGMMRPADNLRME